MGRYKDYHREPRRGGFDDEQRGDSRAFGSRSDYPSTSASQAPDPVEAVVKWFNVEKGFGFVDVVGGSEAFMQIRQLAAAGDRRARGLKSELGGARRALRSPKS